MSLQVIMMYSEGCEACMRTKPIINKIARMHPEIAFYYHKVSNIRYEHFLLNNLGIPIDADVTLSEEEKQELKDQGIPEISALPTFYLSDDRYPFKILETIVGGVNKPKSIIGLRREQAQFEKMFCAMLQKYDEAVNHRSAIKRNYGEFEVKQDPFPNL